MQKYTILHKFINLTLNFMFAGYESGVQCSWCGTGEDPTHVVRARHPVGGRHTLLAQTRDSDGRRSRTKQSATSGQCHVCQNIKP